MTRLKLLWPRLSESQQDYWRQLFDSKMTQAQIRKKIAKELRIALPYDIQITRFREWESDQRDRDHEAEQMKEDERRLTELYPNWTKDQVREDALKKCYLRARARGDASLALRVVAADMKVAAVQTTQ